MYPHDGILCTIYHPTNSWSGYCVKHQALNPFPNFKRIKLIERDIFVRSKESWLHVQSQTRTRV